MSWGLAITALVAAGVGSAVGTWLGLAPLRRANREAERRIAAVRRREREDEYMR